MKRKIYTISILFAIAAIFWFGLGNSSKTSAGINQSQQPQEINKEAVNISKLNDLLMGDNIRVDDSALLPTEVRQSRTIQVRLQSAGADFSEQAAENAQISLLNEKNDSGALSRQRFFELSPTLILVTAVNDQKQVLWWNLQPDPRVFRADEVDAENRVTGKTLYRNSAEMLISLPADKAITELRFYQPIWDGSSYSLRRVGNLNPNGATSSNLQSFLEPFETVLNNGSPANRVDIAVLGDGYTTAQIPQYRTDVQQFIQQVFAQEPHKEYQRYFNVHRIDVTSNQSGSDHPERMPPVFVDTALDGTFNCNNIQRLTCVDVTKVNNIVNASLPANHFDIILVLINDQEYGGSGGAIAVASINPGAFAELVLHEVGHSFGLLADEYTGGGPLCNPNVEPAEVNATRETNRPLIKWNAWINPATPVPTTTTTAATPGLYEGARYCDNGLYRPTFNDKMRTIGMPFEQITTEQHVKRIHAFMSPIDASSPAGTTVAMTTAQTQTFTITPLVPFTHTLNINWTVNGQPAGTGATLNLNGATLPAGQHTVQAIVQDPTPMVRIDPNQVLRATRNWTVNVTAATRRSPFDFDGDSKTDISIFRPSNGEWWYQRSSNNQVSAAQFGTTNDRIAAADYTGDGKTDIAFWRPATGEWYILRSENSTFYAFPFGANGDTPVPADFDGDQKADAAVFRASNLTWYISKSTGGTTIQQFGATGDVPIVADYDGDAKADIAIFRPASGQWWLNRSTAGVIALTFGTATDKQVQGDYTGDGKADVAFWRPSTGEWYVLRSENFSFYAAPFGNATDIPVPGDYDGDGKFDFAVFRPSQVTWYLQRSTAGFIGQQFGLTTDKPVPSAFVP